MKNALEDINSLVKQAYTVSARLQAPMMRRTNAAPAPKKPSNPYRGGNITGEGFGGGTNVRSTGAGIGAPPVTGATVNRPPAKVVAPAAAKPQPAYDFAGDAKKLLTGFRNQYGGFTQAQRQKADTMSAGFKKTWQDMKANPQKYSDQRKRQIMQDWRSQIDRFNRSRQQGQKTYQTGYRGIEVAPQNGSAAGQRWRRMHDPVERNKAWQAAFDAIDPSKPLPKSYVDQAYRNYLPVLRRYGGKAPDPFAGMTAKTYL